MSFRWANTTLSNDFMTTDDKGKLNENSKSVEMLVEKSIYCTFSLALVSSGEPFPENGRSPGSTQHSSPRSDLTSRMFCNNSAPTQNSAPSTTGSSPPDTVTNQNLQPSDVTIQRKESEGFGFVIISSLNRPETAAAAGKE